MDDIQKVLIESNRKDLAQKYYQKVSVHDKIAAGLDTSRLDKEFKKVEDDYGYAKIWYGKLKKAGQDYYSKIIDVLKKSGISVKNSQIYFNDIGDSKKDRALMHIYYNVSLSDRKQKNLEKKLKDLKIPLPVAGVGSRDITVTLYDKTIGR